MNDNFVQGLQWVDGLFALLGIIELVAVPTLAVAIAWLARNWIMSKRGRINASFLAGDSGKASEGGPARWRAW